LRARWAVCTALAALAATHCSAQETAGSEGQRSRIVLITIDTLRADAFDADQMPATHAFATRGLRLQRFFAASNTTQPTHASLLTGLHPWQHGVTHNGAILGDEIETLAETLGAAGYATAAVVASFPLDARFGFAQGFDRFEAPFERSMQMEEWVGNEVEAERFYALAPTISDRVLELLAAASSDRQFFWFHYFDPHGPYGDAATEPAPSWVDAGRLRDRALERDPGFEAALADARAAYLRDVTALDRELGRVFAALDASASAIETHVLLTADHGESFGEHQALGHGFRLSEEELRVPSFLVSPRTAPGERSAVAGSVDFHATVLALAGLTPAAAPGPGRNLLEAPAEPQRRVFGLRNLWAPNTPEVRTNGQIVGISEAHFFAATRDALWSGTPKRIAAPADASRQATEAIGERFGIFARALAQLDQRPPVPELDAQSRAGLRALGYLE
jgi:arylsulfatase A-like enzyme